MCKNTNQHPAFEGSCLPDLSTGAESGRERDFPFPSCQEGTLGVLPQLPLRSLLSLYPKPWKVPNRKWEGLYLWKRPTQLQVSPAPADNSKGENTDVEGSLQDAEIERPGHSAILTKAQLLTRASGILPHGCIWPF